jgi:uncharacterized membrane protein YkvA (DUF1232 family)
MAKEITPLEKAKEGPSGFVKMISEPLSKYGWPVWLVYILAIVGLLYILNPTAGVFEFIPDVIPFVGNLDEGVAMMLVIMGIVEITEGKKYRAVKDNDAKAEPPVEAE